MKNYRKILAFIIALAVMASMAVFPISSSAEEAALDTGTARAELLIKLKILTGVSASKYDAFARVKKYEFGNYIYNMLGDYNAGKNYNENAALHIQNLGVIDSAKAVEKAGGVNKAEAAKMLVVALGYGGAAQNSGGYPTGFLTYAQRLGLLDGVTAEADEDLKMYDVVTMLYNAIECDAAIPIAVDGKVVEYEVEEDKTILNYYRDITKVQGIVTEDFFTGLYGDSSVSDDEIKIGDTTYVIGAGKSDGLLGYPVTAYVKEERGEKGSILHITRNADRYEEIVIDAKDIRSVSGDCKTISYWETESRDKTVTVPSPKVIFNRRLDTTYTKDDLMPEVGSITLLDSDDSGSYDIILVDSAETIFVDSINTTTKQIFNKLDYTGAPEFVSADDNGTGRLTVMHDGAKLELRDIMAEDVILFRRSKGETRPYIHIEVSSVRVTGEPQSFNITKQTVKVNDTVYDLSEAFIKAHRGSAPDYKADSDAQLSLGTGYVFYMSSDMEVAATKPAASTDVKYGFAMKVGKGKGFTPEVKIKVFSQEKDWFEFPFAKKVEHNGTKGLSKEDVYSRLTASGSFEPQLIQYRLNADGEINRIETAIADDGDYTSERLRKVETRGDYRYNDNSFDSKYYFSGATYWLAPSEQYKDDEASYSNTTDRLYLEKDTTYDFIVYNLDEYSFSSHVVIKSMDSQTPPRGNFFVVSDVSTIMTSTGDRAQAITGAYQNYDKLTLHAEVEGMFDDVHPGDILTVRPNRAGKIPEKYGFKVQYSLVNNIVPSVGNIYTPFTPMAGTLVAVDAAKLRMKVNTGYETVSRRMLDYPNVMIYNDKSKIIERGTMADLTKGDFIVYREFWATITDIVAIRK